MLCLSMCLSSSCSKFQVLEWVAVLGCWLGRECLLESHVDAHGGLGDR